MKKETSNFRKKLSNFLRIKKQDIMVIKYNYDL